MFDAAAMDDTRWLAEFHAGNRRVLEACYRDHFSDVERAVGRILSGADQETVVHEVFLRLLSSEEVRRGFSGGSFQAWLSVVARNHAIEFFRRRRRHDEVVQERWLEEEPNELVDRIERQAEARTLIDRFRKEQLPAKWAPVFEVRFLQQLNQREAAAALGMRRTTLAYQELRIRALLQRFLLRGEA